MRLERLNVHYHHKEQTLMVGTLAQQGTSLYFEYDSECIQQGHWLSPFKLPLSSGLQVFNDWRYGDVWGLFADSLPDGWGMLLMDRFFQSKGRLRSTVSILERLAYLGSNTMGALTYHPATGDDRLQETIDLYQLAQESQQVLSGNSSDVLEQLLWLGGSPGGARPKVLVGLRDTELISGVHDLSADYTPYLLKFHAHPDEDEEGLIEESYAQVARLSGLEMPETTLLYEPKSQRYYFGIRRFDRQHNVRVHTHTLGGLLHSNHRYFECDYHNLLQVTRTLTKDQTCMEKVFRQMLFNLVMNNRDDHVKNFSFRYQDGNWQYAPSYDLTFNAGPRGEHSMTISGEGRVPTWSHVQQLAQRHSIPSATMNEMMEQVITASLAWKQIATHLNISDSTIARIESCIESNRMRCRHPNV